MKVVSNYNTSVYKYEFKNNKNSNFQCNIKKNELYRQNCDSVSFCGISSADCESVIHTKFIQFIKSKKKRNHKVPSCIILAGPNTKTKKEFINWLKKEIRRHATFIDFTLRSHSEDFFIT